MKKLALLALVAALATSCSDDETSIPQEDLQLATPALHMRVSTASGESPFTGVLTVMPCQPESSIYFGNYVNHRLTPFYGYYMVYTCFLPLGPSPLAPSNHTSCTSP